MNVRYLDHSAFLIIRLEHVWYQLKVHAIHILNILQMSELVTLNHGSGGTQTQDLIRNVFAAKFGMKGPLTDSAILNDDEFTLAFTTDSYVVDPLFFPGGNIGKLAICGTVNDLSVSGAIPLYISASFIIEEGFPLNDLKIIAESMAEEA